MWFNGKYFSCKLIISGPIYEFYDYEKPQRKGYQLKKKCCRILGRASKADDEERIENRIKTLHRARSKLRRLINTNIGTFKDERGDPYKPKFATLTFAENLKNLKITNKTFRKFIKKLNYLLGYNVEYNGVPEFQKRGAVHYHVIFYNLPYIPAGKLAEIWGQGYIKINKIDDVDNVGAYVCKYLGKNVSDERLAGNKCYFSSRGLKKPVEIIEETQVESVRTALPEPSKTFESIFHNDYTGKVEYTQYNLMRVCTDV